MRHLLSASLLLVLIVPASAALAQVEPLDAVEADRLRIRAHLSSVEADLRAADITGLSPSQRAARAANLDRLHAYRVRGEFPHGNALQPGPRVPTFIDADGRACAMGHLVIESGHRDVAEAIARTQNYARVPQITHPAVGAWLEANGMTLKEATMVQPTYCFEACPDAGTAAVCGSDGNVYSNECLALCEGLTVVGPANCSSGGACVCNDAGAPAPSDGGSLSDGGSTPRDAGTVVPTTDSGLITPRIDSGPGGGGSTSPDDGSCSIGGRGSAAAPAGFVIVLGLAAWRRRRRS